MSEESHSSEVLMHRLVSPGAQKSICRSDSREYQETSMCTVSLRQRNALTGRVLAQIGLWPQQLQHQESIRFGLEGT